MDNKTRIIALLVVLLFVGAAIFYFESQKSRPPAPEDLATPNVRGREEFLGKKAQKYERAKEIVNPSGFINADPFALADLVGKKVILIDFWTYTCINCQRTTPYLNAWHEKYRKDGFAIVGIHTPEFDFEKKYDNVANAVNHEGIKFPVVLDNDYDTWDAYKNRYWPRKYLIDIDGYIIYDHIGEGAYEETEKNIQEALKERRQVLGMQDGKVNGTAVDPEGKIVTDFSKVGSPETYFGSERNMLLANGISNQSGEQAFSLPDVMEKNKIYLEGTWHISPQSARSIANAAVTYRFNAKNAYMVATSDQETMLQIMLDGKPLVQGRGKAVTEEGMLFIQSNDLYHLVEGMMYGEHTLRIEVLEGSLDIYTFTFG